MALTRKDLTATLLTALVVLMFLAAHEGWNGSAQTHRRRLPGAFG
jgi:hypothetical protein